MKRYIKSSRLSHDVDEYQEWIDYDMKHYGRISKETRDEIRKAGFTVTRDQYGDYEVTASKSIKADTRSYKTKWGDDFKVFDTTSPDLNISIYDWYKEDYPDDELGEEVSDITFKSLYNSMLRGKDVYNLLGVGDSIVRERCFDKLAKILNADYDDIYYLWLNSGVEASTDITADTVKKGNKWVNRGDTGEEHGEFKTKKEADAQRRAMFSKGFQGGK